MKVLSLLLVLAAGFNSSAQDHTFTKIDTASFSALEFAGYPEDLTKTRRKISLAAFEISSLVTWKQYKRFLTDAERIKGTNLAQSFTPKLPTEHLNACLESNEFDHLPVVGVSWIAAREYCRWRTVVDSTDGCRFTYEIPKRAEWLTAFRQLEQTKKKHDLNGTYSDWTLNAKDESVELSLGYYYDAYPEDPPVMKRKMAIGASFKYRFPNLKDYNQTFYQDSSYEHIGFRLVKYPSRSQSFGCYEDWLSNYFADHWTELDESNRVTLKFATYSVTFNTSEERLKGRYTSFYANGKKKAEGIFYNNQRVGIWTIWDSLGVKIIEREYNNSFYYKSHFPSAKDQQAIVLKDQNTSPLELNEDGSAIYPHINERDVHWAKRIWTRITPEFNPDLFDDDRLYNLLAFSAQAGKIRMYDTLTDQFTDSLSFENFKKRRSGPIVAYEIKEDFFMDVNRGLAESRIIGICPLAQVTSDGKTRPQPVAWFYYPEIRAILTQAQARYRCVDRFMRSRNVNAEAPSIPGGSRQTLDDLFFFRDYSWKTMSETSIHGKIPLTEPAVENEPPDQSIDGWPFRIEQLEREHDFWIYLNSRD